MMKPLEQWKLEPGIRVGAAYGAKSTGSKQRGIMYHRTVYKRFEKLLSAEQGVRFLKEPWYRCLTRACARSPDSVILLPELNIGVVVEVKLNWKDGRDRKLLDEYLPIVKAAHDLEVVFPLLVTQCLRGYQHPPLIGLRRWEEAMAWQPGSPTPLLLEPK
jgi:hypothetical protein